MSIRILEADLSDPELQRLIALQRSHAAAHTPPGSGHAVQVGTAPSGIRYFIALEDEEAVGCIGLAPLRSAEAEIKTMHVIEARRGEGIAQLLLQAVVEAAAASGIKELKLETGRSQGFAASRRFYEKEGFTPCERYGRYSNDNFSFCMSRTL